MFYVSTALAVLLAVRGVATAADAKPGTAKPEVVTAAEAQAQAMRTMQASIAKQKEAVRRQFLGARLFTGIPWVGGTATPVTPLAQAPADCDPLGEAQMAPLIASAATTQKLRPELLRAVIRQESAFRPCAVSPKGAMGLMQIMPDTADEFQMADPFDPGENVQTGAKYLKQLLERFGGELPLALAAYNAGPARIEGKAIPDIPETRAYVQQILKEVEKTNP